MANRHNTTDSGVWGDDCLTICTDALMTMHNTYLTSHANILHRQSGTSAVKKRHFGIGKTALAVAKVALATARHHIMHTPL